MRSRNLMLCSLCLSVSILCSCRQRIVSTEDKTTTRLTARTDTVSLRLLVADSVVLRERTLGDTFYKEKEHFRTLVKDHFRQHTDTLILRDTVRIARTESKAAASLSSVSFISKVAACVGIIALLVWWRGRGVFFV